MLHPIRIAVTIGRCGNFKCPYHARVMKMLEQISSRIVVIARG
jgi:hypothetical protein